MFIVLTDERDRKVRYHVHNLTKYVQRESEDGDIFTHLHFISSGWDIVKETPEEIDKLLMESYVTVKDLSRKVSS